MSNPGQPVNSLGEFVERVATVREQWNLPGHEELWSRGESKDYGDTILRPELYRPAQPGVPLKPIIKRPEIENDLSEEFRRIAVELAHEKTSDEDWH
jgi:hypothetical protein